MRFILQDCEPVAAADRSAACGAARAIAPAGCAIIDIARCAGRRRRRRAPLPVVDAARRPLYFTRRDRPAGPRASARRTPTCCSSSTPTAGPSGSAQAIACSMLYKLGFAAGIGGICAASRWARRCAPTTCSATASRELADWLDRERITVLHPFPMVFREMAKRLGPKRVLPHLRVDAPGRRIGIRRRRRALPRAHARPLRARAPALGHRDAASSRRTSSATTRPCRRRACFPSDGRSTACASRSMRDDGSIAPQDEAGEMIVCSRARQPRLLAPARARRGRIFRRSAAAGRAALPQRRLRAHRRRRRPAFPRPQGQPRQDSRAHGRPGRSRGGARLVPGRRAWRRGRRSADPAQPQSSRLVAYVRIAPGRRARPVGGAAPSRGQPAAAHAARGDSLRRRVAAHRRAASSTASCSRQAPTLPRRSAAARTAPRDATEAAVAHVFEQLLKVGAVAPEDDFFLLGGDSLLRRRAAGALAARRSACTSATCTRTATVAGIAAASAASARAVRRRRRARSRCIVPLWQSGARPPLFIVHGRHGQAFVSPHFMQLLGNDQPVWAFQARGLDGVREPHATVEAMADEYLARNAQRSVRTGPISSARCAPASSS